MRYSKSFKIVLITFLLTSMTVQASSSKSWDAIPMKPYSYDEDQGQGIIDNPINQRITSRLANKQGRYRVGAGSKIDNRDSAGQTSSNAGGSYTDSDYSEMTPRQIGEWEMFTDKTEERKLTSTVKTTQGDQKDIENIIEAGMSVLGNRYKYGGDNPYVKSPLGTSVSDGIDCSGFVKFCYKYGANIELTNRSTSAFLANTGREVPQSEMRPGDIILISKTSSKSGGVTHCGIYLGGGKMIHAGGSGTKSRVKIDSLHGTPENMSQSAGGGRKIKSVKRVIEI